MESSVDVLNNEINDSNSISLIKTKPLPLYKEALYLFKKYFSPSTYTNSFSLINDTQLYRFIYDVIKVNKANFNFKPLAGIETIKGKFIVITNTDLIRSVLKYPRLEQGEFFSEGRQLRVIADGLGKIRLSADRSDMKAKRSILASLLAKPERYLPKMFEITDKLVQKWLNGPKELLITQDISAYTVEMFLGPIMDCKGPFEPIVAILEEQIHLLGKHLVYKTPANFSNLFKQLRMQLVHLITNSSYPSQAKQYDDQLNRYIDQSHQSHEQEAYEVGLNSGTLAGYLAPNPSFLAIIYQLGLFPEWQTVLYQEWQKAQSKGLTVTNYIMQEDSLLHAVIHEVLRLHPAQPFLFRNAAENLMLDGHFLKKGDQIILNLYHAQQDVSIWGQDAAHFNPLRFIENPSLYGKHFLTFSSGPNNCTGQFFSRLQLKTFTHLLCSNLIWETINKTVKHKFHFALIFDSDINIKIRQRIPSA